jgi:hypothetical protein
MRKLIMLGALVTIFSLVVAAPALADLIVELGPYNNTYNERRCLPDGDEEVFGRRGHDRLLLNECGDDGVEDGLPQTPDENDSDVDNANGNRGSDVIKVNDGDIQDTARGGLGQHDKCVGDRDLGSDKAVGDPTPESGGPDEDISDKLDEESCETIVWKDGDFYNQT